MSILKLLYYPDKRLRKIAKPVKKIDYRICSIIKNMFSIMYENNGIGLAATQINVHERIIVIDISSNYESKLVLINPIVVSVSGSISLNEGCLSVPKTYFYVPRYKTIKIKALNSDGIFFEIETNDLLSVCIQHEIDHLNGVLFIDYLRNNKFE